MKECYGIYLVCLMQHLIVFIKYGHGKCRLLFVFSGQATFDRLHLFDFVFIPWVKMISSLNEYCGNYNSLIERMNGINEIKHIHV